MTCMSRTPRKTPPRRKAVASVPALRLPAAIAVAGAAALAGPSAASAQPHAQDTPSAVASLEDRVARVREVLASGPGALLSAAQTPNWTNWPKWSKWSNWANK